MCFSGAQFCVSLKSYGGLWAVVVVGNALVCSIPLYGPKYSLLAPTDEGCISSRAMGYFVPWTPGHVAPMSNLAPGHDGTWASAPLVYIQVRAKHSAGTGARNNWFSAMSTGRVLAKGAAIDRNPQVRRHQPNPTICWQGRMLALGSIRHRIA